MGEFLDKCEAARLAPISGHLHTCFGKHTIHEDHFCPDCRKWWWEK